MIKSFGGMIQVKGEGTIVWKIEDDDGIVHPNKTKKVLYALEAPSCLLAPKQWSQKADKIILSPTAHGATPRPATVSFIGNRNGTAIPSPGILQ